MPTKTDRILSYLPRTFQTAPRPPVLFAVADAFGAELLLGENSLAAVMLAHWVDFADKNAERIDDLARMAALYGLAPRREDDEDLESVEEFRERLKRYVRTFLEGTVTVQGILRVTSEALALHIADETEQLDRWWTRRRDELATIEPRGDDAAALLRFDRPSATGSPARPAQVTGVVDLSGGIELAGASILRLKVDGVDLGEIDLAAGIAPPARLTLDQIVQTINQSPRPQIARHDGRHLTLASPKTGPENRLELIEGPNDAAPRLLGLAPRSYHGGGAAAAQLVGAVDLSQGVDLGQGRFLRVEIDGKYLAEIDCAGKTTLAQLGGAINQALGVAVASDDGKHLILTSPTTGFQSAISVQPPTAQSAALRIFGVATAFRAGRDAQPASVTSARDLRGGVDLSERANLRLRLDGAAPVTINCAGDDPAKTQRIEIVAAINAALKANVASVTERGVNLTLPTAGPGSEIVFETAQTGDAASDIFGIGPLSFVGSAAVRARLIATPALTKSGGLDVRAQSALALAVDGGAPIETDLRQAAETVAELASVSLDKLAATINSALGGANVATTDGQRLLFASPTEGGASSLAVEPLEITRRRRFVTRAIITDEATQAIFGFDAKDAQGALSAKARVVGAADLSQSVDLRETRLLRLKIDSYPAREIDCAGPRARATTLDEIVKRVNDALKDVAGALKDVAAHDGKHLVLTSPSSGADSRIAFEPPRAALETLLGVEPGITRGQDAAQVSFIGAVDLSAGIDLDPQAAIKIGFDGNAPVEISLAGPAPNHQSLLQIATAINVALQATVASSDGKHLILSSAKKGTDSKIVFEAPAAHDVTIRIFGFAPPRSYQGEAATPARVEGARDLSGPVDLSVFRFLRLSVDGGPVENVDCAAEASKPEAAKLAEIVQSIRPQIASISPDGKRLILTSPTSGATGQITLEAYSPGDARRRLLCEVADSASGTAPAPAVITGEADLLAPVNLEKRSLLRLAVDGGRPVEIDVAGALAAKTSSDEIVARINHVFPNLAAITENDRLQLTSPTAGAASRLSVLPLRYLEVIEYPPLPAPSLSLPARHHDPWSVVNDGAADSYADVRITAPQGASGPMLVNATLGWAARLFTVVDVGETASLRRSADGALQAEILSAEGQPRPVPGGRILVGPLGAQVWVPFTGTWSLLGGTGNVATLQLNNALAPAILLLRAQQPGEITVSVTESNLTRYATPPVAADDDTARLVGRVSVVGGEIRLLNAAGNAIAQLRAGPQVDPLAFTGYVVKVTGPLHAGAPPLLIVQTITRLFDVTLRSAHKDDPPAPDVVEQFLGVTIGVGAMEDDSLALQFNAGSRQVAASKLARAEELEKATVLGLPRGKTDWRYLDCQGSRFDQARFNRARFPDGVCGERGVFDVSRFTSVDSPDPIKAVFAAAGPLTDPVVEIDFRWTIHQPGAFIVNLPADLPARFGGRFNDARFGQNKDEPEIYAGAVAEPETDTNFLATMINSRPSILVKASVVENVNLGWAPIKLPFRKPQFLTLGAESREARLYLTEEGLNGKFILLKASQPGVWGNEIAVTARPSGPAIYDVSIIYRGSRFENARAVALGQPPGELTQTLLRPGPIGVLQAKAAGVRAEITRDRAEFE